MRGRPAVVFDFFGTLTDPSAEADRRASFTPTAAALGIAPDDFWAAMSASFPRRIVGAFGGTRSTLAAVAAACGVTASAEALDAAVAAQRAGAVAVRRPRPGVLDVLRELRDSGFRLGVLSDCSSELVEAWPATDYAARVDAAVFSWREGYRKPDTRLYATVAARLGIAAEHCWYVGDGGSREHQGARAAGMRPVLVTNAAYPQAYLHRDDPDTFVPDLVIDDVVDLLDLVRRPGSTARDTAV
jgi:putative hydrolase of the HAD superfamily